MKPSFEPSDWASLHVSKIGRLLFGGDLHSATHVIRFRDPKVLSMTRGPSKPIFHTIIRISGGSLENCGKVECGPVVEILVVILPDFLVIVFRREGGYEFNRLIYERISVYISLSSRFFSFQISIHESSRRQWNPVSLPESEFTLQKI